MYREGKCLYCEYHELTRDKFACKNKAKGVRLKAQHKYAAPACKSRRLPHACGKPGLEESYPDNFSPAFLEGTCENWRLQGYEEEEK